ncbi:hypothetical protein ABNN70_06430 [Sporolactobacillus sp. Y61]|uniref:Cas10/Cmr2 second palm domain-containing protein n=1 Tax=Sporolactobacillus sp. Y61 TaxID=3160863 RepID=A0AAU8IJ01_9BACL
MKTLDIIEVGKKQKYIFQSNRLKEIVGASMIIRYISEKLPKEIMDKHECDVGKPTAVIEGGGHSIYSFDSEDEARKFNHILSKYVVIHFPGLELNCRLLSYNDENESIRDAIDQLFKELAVKKSKGSASLSQISFGIERLCESSQLPADKDYTVIDGEERRALSPEIKCKLDFVRKYKPSDYFSDLIPETPYHMFRIHVDMDKLAGNEKSKIAVIHIDGNGMGKKLNRFKDMNQKAPGESVSDFNNRYQKSFRDFSKGIDSKYKQAFNTMLVRLEKRIVQAEEHSSLKIYQNDKVNIRPLIFAGDDISFIVPGNLGVEAARMMLEEIQREPLVIHGSRGQEENVTMHASAGVAIVKSGYPFSVAHDLAEQLCGNAKSRLASDVAAGIVAGDDASVLDFHVLNGTWNVSLSRYRQNNYNRKVNGRSFRLSMKPLYVFLNQRVRNESDVWDFSLFTEALKRITDNKMARNKIKRLREHLLLGPGETTRYIRLAGLSDPLTKSFPPLPEGTLFAASPDHVPVCLYFDAIESMDDVILMDE